MIGTILAWAGMVLMLVIILGLVLLISVGVAWVVSIIIERIKFG